VSNLLEDIKGLYKIAGFKGQSVCFLFTDAEVKDEAFLEYINQLLMTGEVAGARGRGWCLHKQGGGARSQTQPEVVAVAASSSRPERL
jgi:hypothetical protein